MPQNVIDIDIAMDWIDTHCLDSGRVGRIIVALGAEVKKATGAVAKTTGGEVMAKVLERKSSCTMALASLNPDYPTCEFKPAEIAWIARFLWASQ
jgi:phage repressor protein C with HTH and peptisase S24 domain